MKSHTRSPGIRRAIERAARIGFKVEFCDFVTSSALPTVIPPAGLCDHERRTIKVGTRDLTRKGAPPHSRQVLLAILEHELEHAEGAEHATDRPDLGLKCGGTLGGLAMMIAARPAALVSGARLVSINLQRARGTWVRMCPRWFMTGSPAAWTTSEPKLRTAEEQRLRRR